MVFNVSIVKRGKACKTCGKTVMKGEKVIEKVVFLPNMKFPMKENMCLECAQEFVRPEFIKFLDTLSYKLKQLTKEL